MEEVLFRAAMMTAKSMIWLEIKFAEHRVEMKMRAEMKVRFSPK